MRKHFGEQPDNEAAECCFCLAQIIQLRLRLQVNGLWVPQHTDQADTCALTSDQR